MKYILTLCAIIGIGVLSPYFANGQTEGETSQHFDKAGLAFDFPVGWKLTDSSTDDVQHIAVAPEDGAVQIAITAQLISVQQCDFSAVGKR